MDMIKNSLIQQIEMALDTVQQCRLGADDEELDSLHRCLERCLCYLEEKHETRTQDPVDAVQ